MNIRSLTLAAVVSVSLLGSYAANSGSAEAALASTEGNTIYVGTANGGVWKTTDGGSNWNRMPAAPTFDSLDEEAGMLVPAVQPVRCAGKYC